MRNRFVVALLVVLAARAFSQDEETLLTGRLTHGGFGGPVVKFTRLGDEFGVLVGGRGGWIINRCFSIGGGGYGLVNSIPGPDGIPLMVEPVLTVGYGGFEMEYIRHSGKLIHSTVNLLIGAGGVGYHEKQDEDWDFENDVDGNPTWDSFFIIEPGIGLELNITSFFRIDAGASYRFVSGVEKNGLTNGEIGGPSAVITFKFGKF
jgi:hypothetical protein